MKIYDMHVHALNTEPKPEQLLAQMEAVGVYGSTVFSNWPKESNPRTGTSFDERLEEVFAWTNGYEGRLFPVMFIHPYEENIIENIHKAVDRGILAFKIICTNFYVYEEQSMKVIREIASLGKPIFFHSGILWDGAVSSRYNRPLNWEDLLMVPNLKFSLGHCSWPWIDECIALYGKFLNSRKRELTTAEMFFDITPGTPAIYREELLYKLFKIGYDVNDNIMFGSDGRTHNYPLGIKSYLEMDGKILDKLEIGEDVRQKIYCDNLMRFLGLKEVNKPKEAYENVTSGW